MPVTRKQAAEMLQRWGERVGAPAARSLHRDRWGEQRVFCGGHAEQHAATDRGPRLRIMPGDMDRMRWTLHECAENDQDALVRSSKLPHSRAVGALRELERLGHARHEVGHHHDGEFCQCRSGGPVMISWYLREPA